MPGLGRLGDTASVPTDAHGCPACPHPGVGPAIGGSPNVNANGRPALRVDDSGMHAACCGPNMWTAVAGSATVFINGKKAFRIGDATSHCGGSGKLVEGSGNVIVGDSTSGGGGGGGSSGAGEGGSASGASSTPAAGGAAASSGGGEPSPGGEGSSSASDAAGGAAGGGAVAAADGAAGPKAQTAPEPELTFIEIELVGEDGSPIADERYLIEHEDGSPPHSGYTDDRGRARIHGLKPGSCTVSFPDLDADAWSKT